MKLVKIIISATLALSLVFAMASCKKQNENENKNDNNTPTVEESGIPAPITYEEYQALSPENRQAYYNKFADPNDFFDWYNAAFAQYKAENPGTDLEGEFDVEIGNGSDAN